MIKNRIRNLIKYFKNCWKFRHFLYYDRKDELFHYSIFHVIRPKLKEYAEAVRDNKLIIKYTPKQRRKIYRRAISTYNVLNDLFEGNTYFKLPKFSLPSNDDNYSIKRHNSMYEMDDRYLKYFWYMMSKYSEEWGI